MNANGAHPTDDDYWRQAGNEEDGDAPTLTYDPLADPEAIDRLLARFNGAGLVPAAAHELTPDPDLDAVLAETDPDYDWLVPGVLERGDRVIVTGVEGTGKSTLLRQLAVQLAAGIHPFTLDPIPGLTVLYVDLENSRRQSKRKLKPLRIAAGPRYPTALMHPVIVPQGMDLTTPDDRVWLEERVKADHPDLLIVGPIYKMVGGDPTEEEPARVAARFLDHLRTVYDIALIIEAHSPHAANGKSARPERPYGASLWVRWPEFGLHLSPTGQLNHWRGDRDERSWPAALKRGGEWPWTPVTDPKAQTFARILDVVTTAGHPMSYREVGLEIDQSKTWVERAVNANPQNRQQWDDLIERLGGDF